MELTSLESALAILIVLWVLFVPISKPSNRSARTVDHRTFDSARMAKILETQDVSERLSEHVASGGFSFQVRSSPVIGSVSR